MTTMWLLPLHQNMLVIPHVCAHLVALFWAGGSMMEMMITLVVFHCTFWDSIGMHHFLSCGFSQLIFTYGAEIACHCGCDTVWLVPDRPLIPHWSLLYLHRATILRIPSAVCFPSYFGDLACSSVSVICLKHRGPHFLYNDTLMSTTYTSVL